MKKLIFVLLIFAACSTEKTKELSHWYKGNTHTHTVICGHADTHPDTVALWYLERDYNFLILSEHNTFINPDSVNLPENRREDFILIPGEEVSDEKHIHTTAMNINRLIPVGFPFRHDTVRYNPYENLKIYYMQKHVDSIRFAGGIPILNHPNWQTGAPASSIQQVERLHMIELYNGHPDVNNWGNNRHASMEVKWDSLLTAGRKIYGVSSDDAHFFQEWAVDVSNPGRGWVMVRSEELTPDGITNAMKKGDFYSSNGVILADIDISTKGYKISIDTAATYQATQSPYVVGYKLNEVKDGFQIDFITDNGEVINSTKDLQSEMEIPSEATYLRAKITYSRSRGNSSEQFFAWTQPFFIKSE